MDNEWEQHLRDLQAKHDALRAVVVDLVQLIDKHHPNAILIIKGQSDLDIDARRALGLK